MARIAFFVLIIACFIGLPSVVAHGQSYEVPPFVQDTLYLSGKGKVRGIKESVYAPPADSIMNWEDGLKGVPGGGWSLVYTVSYAFDTLGRQWKWERSAGGRYKEGKAFGAEIRTYDDKGLKALVRTESGKKDSLSLVYKKNGLLESYAMYTGRGKLAYIVEFVYGNGQKISTIRKRDAGNMAIGMIKFRYEQGKKTEELYYDEQYRHYGTLKTSAKSDKAGFRNVSGAFFDKDNKLKEGWSRSLDAMGHPLDQSGIGPDREMSVYRVFEYDEKGNKVREKQSLPDEYEWKMRYRYDERGNWTLCEAYLNDVLEEVRLREIDYRD